jgi:hypothetical protein
MKNTDVLVLDVPYSTSADEATSLMNAPYRRGFYIHRAMPMDNHCRMRVVYVRKRPSPKTKAKDAYDSVAVRFLRDNLQTMTIKEIAVALKAEGYPQDERWLFDKRAEIMKDRRG